MPNKVNRHMRSKSNTTMSNSLNVKEVSFKGTEIVQDADSDGRIEGEGNCITSLPELGKNQEEEVVRETQEPKFTTNPEIGVTEEEGCIDLEILFKKLCQQDRDEKKKEVFEDVDMVEPMEEPGRDVVGFIDVNHVE
ncbi:hypothetical protein FRX31_006879 [Thalictrum thalictroides]|uniref:Uncharacterized protein n=1 Tax=Thalictrum thalictroides TaxID=46969 RepID=A0A7J6X409_THATH|nr:hypothetical protein FRX31_006879 [Thalictrum thalictroides]